MIVTVTYCGHDVLDVAVTLEELLELEEAAVELAGDEELAALAAEETLEAKALAAAEALALADEAALEDADAVVALRALLIIAVTLLFDEDTVEIPLKVMLFEVG